MSFAILDGTICYYAVRRINCAFFWQAYELDLLNLLKEIQSETKKNINLLLFKNSFLAYHNIPVDLSILKIYIPTGRIR